MKIKFWGVRGSIPCPGPQTTRYGGNTPCIELSLRNSTRRIIIDAGSGIRELGNDLTAQTGFGSAFTAEIFLTHTHWDHIQGFPFFAPIYAPDTRLKIYGPRLYRNRGLKEALAGQLNHCYFPVELSELASSIEYIDLDEGRFDLGDGLTLTTKYLNHTLLCLGYRFEFEGKTVCTAYDTEPYPFCHSDIDDYPSQFSMNNRTSSDEQNRCVRLLEFYHNADVLIHDTQYTREEYENSKTGWGHSTFEHAITAGKSAGVKRLALFHHEPVRTDNDLDALSATYCHPAYGGTTDVFMAREGMQIDI